MKNGIKPRFIRDIFEEWLARHGAQVPPSQIKIDKLATMIVESPHLPSALAGRTYESRERQMWLARCLAGEVPEEPSAKPIISPTPPRASTRPTCIGVDGPPCPVCDAPMEVRGHREISPRLLQQKFYYSRWYECARKRCPGGQRPVEFIVWNILDGPERRRLEGFTKNNEIKRAYGLERARKEHATNLKYQERQIDARERQLLEREKAIEAHERRLPNTTRSNVHYLSPAERRRNNLERHADAMLAGGVPKGKR